MCDTIAIVFSYGKKSLVLLVSSPCIHQTDVMLLCIERNETFDLEEDDDEYNNYDITEICSDDSTDDETNPKRLPPSWAEGMCLCCCIHALELVRAVLEQVFNCHLTCEISNIMKSCGSHT